MARFDIKSYNGQVTRFSGKLRYNGNFGGVSYVEFAEIASPTLIDFHVGDYVDYSRTGFRYKLYSVPRPTKKSGNNTVGDTYVYKNVQLFCATKDLELAPFRDLVLNDNLIHFTTLPTISVYDDVYGIVDRLQACMDDYSGSGVWDIKVMTTSDATILAKLHEEREFSVSNVSVLEAMNEIYKLWGGIGWIYTTVNGVNTITFGRPNIQNAGNTTDVFSYGLGNGLRVIAQALSSKNEMATRLYAYGSDRNMPPRYYNNLSPAIFSAESVYIPNLMIPTAAWGSTSNKKDARKAYVENSSAIQELGLIPKTIYFDGSGDYEEIYPSLEGMTFEQLRSAMSSGDDYYPSNIYSNGDPVNTVKGVVNPTDNGVLENAGSKYAESGTDSWLAIDDEFTYVEGQEVLNINPGGTLVTYEATHSGRMKINVPAVFSVDCADMGEVTANIVVTLNDEAVQIVPLEVNRLRMGAYFETVPITQEVEAGDEVGIVVGGEVRLVDGHTGGTCYVSADAGTADFNVQYTIGDAFTLTIKQIGFDISKQGTSLSNGLATICMKSGMCGGREFVVKSCKYNDATDDWTLQCYRQKDDSLGQYFPNTIYPIAAGDSYVLTDMMMPALYVRAAEQRLLDRANEVLALLSKPKVVYTPEIDAKVLALSPETILEGMYMPVYDENLIPTTVQAYPHTSWILISTLVIAEDEAEIPTYKVTLQDEKAGTFLQSYTNEMSRNATRMRLEDIEGARSPYIPDEDITGAAAVPYLEITASSDFFTYPAGAVAPVEGTIILQALPQDIPNPSYQWYWLGTQDWEELEGETGQTYEVDPDSNIYYQNGELAEDFLCVVTSGAASYTARKVIVKITGGENGLTVMLNNPAHVFAASATAASQATDTISVIAYRGLTRVATTVGTITGQQTGMTTSISDNTTDHTTITVSVTTALTWRSGTLTIPVTAEGQTINLTYSWALANRGNTGNTGPSGTDGYNTAFVLLYQRAASAPAKPSGDLTYTFSTASISGSTLGSWSLTPPATDGNPLWMISAKAVSRTDTDTIESSEWSSQAKFVEDGLPGATGKIMRGPTDWVSGFPYQGLNDTGSFVDYVFYNGDYTKLYLCLKNTASVAPGNTTYWQQTTLLDFVATKVFYASLGFVDNLGVRVVKIEQSGSIYGGFMPPNTNYGEDGMGGYVNNGNYIFWAGAAQPGNAVFSVDKDGVMKATAGIFSGFLQMPFVPLRTNTTYTSTNKYTLASKCNLYTEYDYLDLTLVLPCDSAQLGKIVNIWDYPIKTQSTVAGFKIRTSVTGALYDKDTYSSYSLSPGTEFNTGSGGYLQLVAVPYGNSVVWMVTINSCHGYSLQ